MLMDFEKEKKKLKDIYQNYIKNKIGIESLSSLFKKIRIFEGDRFVIIREDGTQDENIFERIESEMKIEKDEIKEDIEKGNLNNIMNRLNELSESIAKKESKFVVDKLEETTEKYGNIVNGKGKPLVETYFEMLSKIEIDFDENGLPNEMIFIGNEKIKKEIEKQLHADPTYQKRCDEIINKKRNEWRERESSRTLVG